MNKRRTSKPIQIGSVTVGGGAPIVVQSMTKTDTRDVMSTIYQIRELEDCDCELVRVAVPDAEAAQAIRAIKRGISIPIIADIHFDYRLALMALEAGVDGLRLNPGNISEPKRVRAIAQAAKERNVPIRIGVNAGSLPKTANPKLTIAQRMVDAALEQIRLLESLDFDLILPHPREEVIAAYEILKSLNLRQHGPILVSCPSCGRAEVDIVKLAEAVEEELLKIKKPIKVAVMGCVVNGPGEARDADVGIACGKGKAILFKKGKKIKTIQEKDFVTALMAEVERF